MKKYLISTLILIYFVLNTSAQNTFDKVFALNTLTKVSVGHTLGFAKVGKYFYSYGAGWDDKVTDYSFTLWVTKSDEYGNILDHRYINHGTDWLVPYGEIENRVSIGGLSDSTFVLVITNSNTSNNDVFCINDKLEVLWITPIVIVAANKTESPRDLIVLDNSIYILTMRPDSNFGYYGEIRVTKLDFEGNIIKSIVTNKIQSGFELYHNGYDSLLYVSGFKKLASKFDEVEGKFDRNLDLIEYRTISRDTIRTDQILKKAAIQDSEDIMVASSDMDFAPNYSPEERLYGFELNLSRRNKELEIIWNLKLSSPTSFKNGFSDIIPSNDGNYFVYGQIITFAYDVADQSSFSDSLAVRNHFIIKVSPDGEIIWRRQGCSRFYEPHAFGENNTASIIAMDDGGVMVNGCIQYVDSFPLPGYYYKGWIMRLDKDGCLAEGDCAISGNDYIDHVDNNNLLIYPNPNSGAFELDGSEMRASIKDVSVSDIWGQKILYINNSDHRTRISIDLVTQLPGFYFLQYRTSEDKVGVKKIIISR